LETQEDKWPSHLLRKKNTQNLKRKHVTGFKREETHLIRGLVTLLLGLYSSHCLEDFPKLKKSPKANKSDKQLKTTFFAREIGNLPSKGVKSYREEHKAIKLDAPHLLAYHATGQFFRGLRQDR